MLSSVKDLTPVQRRVKLFNTALLTLANLSYTLFISKALHYCRKPPSWGPVGSAALLVALHYVGREVTLGYVRMAGTPCLQRRHNSRSLRVSQAAYLAVMFHHHFPQVLSVQSLAECRRILQHVKYVLGKLHLAPHLQLAGGASAPRGTARQTPVQPARLQRR